MNTTLNKIKEEMINKVVNQLTEMRYMTSQEKEVYKDDLIKKLKEKLLVTKLRTQTDITNADDYNQTAYELYLDIMTAFNYVDTLYETINSHQQLNESIMNTINTTIAELNEKLDEYESIIGSPNANQCFIEGFHTQNNQETNPIYYTERYGEKISLSNYVKFNPEQENITLNYTRQQNVMVYKSGVQLGEISITKQYGTGFVKARNSESKLENAIDTSNSSYWSETILANSEIKILGEEFSNPNGLGQGNRSYYDLPRGALCEICLTFEAMAKINEIVLKPFGAFPIDIIAIRYALSDEEDDETYDVLCPDNPKYSWLNSTTIKQEYAFHFPQITCKKLYILINQLHCIKNTYLISCDQMFKNELWFNSTYNELADVKMDNTVVFAPNYIDRNNEDPIWTYINNKMITNKNIDINDLLINNKNKLLPVTKYQYTYGFYNIAPNFVEFQMAGIYVSQEIESDNPINTIKLYSEEEHFQTQDGYIGTDIEFYITNKKNPSYNDWKPICPYNKDYVYKERLQLDYDYCYLRHPAVCGNTVTTDKNNNVIKTDMVRPIVYYNDIVLTEDADYILRFNNNGDVIAIEISAIDYFGIYTVSYQPVDYSKEISLIDDMTGLPANSYEEIMGNGTSCYKLDAFPYYNLNNPEYTNTYVKIIDIDTNNVLTQNNGDMSPIECVTNKEHTNDSYKNFVANTNKIQYYTNGRYLYFNQPITSNQKIEISYPSYNCKIRVKIILRRNSKKDLWITPVLKKYKLEFTTI